MQKSIGICLNKKVAGINKIDVRFEASSRSEEGRATSSNRVIFIVGSSLVNHIKDIPHVGFLRFKLNILRRRRRQSSICLRRDTVISPVVHSSVQRHVTIFICHVNRCRSSCEQCFQYLQITSSSCGNVKASQLSTIGLCHKF